MSTMFYKVQYQSTVRRIPFTEGYLSFLSSAATAFGLAADTSPLSLTYEDEDGDTVTVGGSAEFEAALPTMSTPKFILSTAAPPAASAPTAAQASAPPQPAPSPASQLLHVASTLAAAGMNHLTQLGSSGGSFMCVRGSQSS